jgi:hypothetical protein
VSAFCEVVETVSSHVVDRGASLGIDGEANDMGRCKNGLSVETTAWEGWNAKQEGAKRGAT